MGAPAHRRGEALLAGGWTLKRSKKHLIYERVAQLASHAQARRGQAALATARGAASVRQTVTIASTPSDSRAMLNALRELARADADAD
jgi:hypothetical protein